MSLRQNVAYAGSGAIAMPGRQGKMGGGNVQDLSAYMEVWPWICSSDRLCLMRLMPRTSAHRSRTCPLKSSETLH
eukprot:751083-Hanusia_phi.AAC.3